MRLLDYTTTLQHCQPLQFVELSMLFREQLNITQLAGEKFKRH